MSAFVGVTFGGRRFHMPLCDAQDAGRGLSWSRYELRWVLPEAAARAGYTACRVCVPPALALPATGQTYGHEPVNMWPDGLACARCYTRTWHSAYAEPDDTERERWDEIHAVPWPCTSALVLGLSPRDGA